MLTVKRNDSLSKKDFVENTLAETLRNARLNVRDLKLSENGNQAVILYNGGHEKHINIERDSFGEIVRDVINQAIC